MKLMNILKLLQSLAAYGQPAPAVKVNGRPDHSASSSVFFRGHRIPLETGPLSLLLARDLVVVADVENLSYSARNAGFRFSYAALGAALAETTKTARLHACFSRQAHHRDWEGYFAQRGWIPHARDIAYSERRNGTRKHANADALIAFHSGRLAAETNADILVATGDGALATDVANSIAEVWPDRLIFTLAFPGAASASLRATNRSSIAGNLLVGLDVLHPDNPRHQ